MDISEQEVRIVIAGLAKLPIEVGLQTFMKFQSALAEMTKPVEVKPPEQPPEA